MSSLRVKALAPVQQQVLNVRFPGPASSSGDATGLIRRVFVARDLIRSTRWLWIAGMLFASGITAPGWALKSPPSSRSQWEQSFQVRVSPAAVNRLRIVPATRCVRDALNKCTFSAAVDYDGDGKPDRAQMMDGPDFSAIVVTFADPSRRPSLAVASFKGRWDGRCYIAPAKAYRNAIALICPESSAAVFALQNGKPSVLWLAD